MPVQADQYKGFIAAGMPPVEAAKAAGILDPEFSSAMLDAAESKGFDEYGSAAAHMLQSAGRYSPERVLGTAKLMREQGITPDFYREGVMEEQERTSSIWKKIFVDPAMAGIGILGMPQQALYRAAMGDDIRKAIPTILLPKTIEDAWAEEGIEHELVFSSDVMNDWSNGGYEAWKEDLNDDPAFVKWAAKIGSFVGELGIDIALDPMTYLAGAGLGAKTANAMRKSLPAAMRVEYATKAVYRSESVTGYRRALAEVGDTIVALKKAHVAAVAAGDTVKIAKLEHQIEQYGNHMLSLGDNYKEYSLLDDFAQRPGTAKPKKLAKPGENASELEIAQYKLQKASEEIVDPLVSFEYMSDTALRAHLNIGADDAQMLGDALRDVAVRGNGSRAQVRNLFHQVDPASHSGEVRLQGIGVRGEITREYAESARVVGFVTDTLTDLNATIAGYKSALTSGLKTTLEPVSAGTRGVGRVALVGQEAAERRYPTLLSGKHPIPTDLHGDQIQKELDELLEVRKKLMAAMDVRKKTGQWDEKLLEPLGIKLPFGPRRSLWNSADYLEGRWGGNFGKLWSKALYPGSFTVNMPEWAQANIFFREPMRVLEERMPGVWEFLHGRMKMAEAEKLTATEGFRDIFKRYGVLNKLGRVNKKESAVLGELLDTARYDKDWITAVLAEGEEVGNVSAALRTKLEGQGLKEISDGWTTVLTKHGLEEGKGLVAAHDEARKMLDEFAVKLGFTVGDPSTGYISGYLTHLISPDLVKNGRLDPVLRGLDPNTIARLPWFMKERIGSKVPTYDAVAMLDIYTRGVTKHLYTDPALAELSRRTAEYVAKSGDTAMTRFSDMLVSNMQGKPSAIGQLLEAISPELAHGARRAAAYIGALTYSSALTGNPRYPIMSMLQNFNTTAAEFGVLRTLKASANMMRPEYRIAAKAAGLEKTHIRMMDDIMSEFSKWSVEWSPKAFGKKVAPSIADTEMMIRGVTYHASLGAQLQELGVKTLDAILDPIMRSNVVATAVKDSESINHVFGKLNRPAAFGRLSQTGSAVASQFLSFPFKQSETLWAHTKKNPGFIFDYLVMSGQMVRIAHRVNVDIEKYVGIGYAKDSLLLDHDRVVSMPVKFMLAGMRAVDAVGDLAMPESEKLIRVAEFKDELKNLIPARVAWNHLSKIIDGLETGQRHAKDGSLIRDVNMSIFPTEAGQPELLAILTGMQSMQDAATNEARREGRARQMEMAARRFRMAQKIADYDGGKTIPIELLHNYNELARGWGIPTMNMSQFQQMVGDRTQRLLLPARERAFNSPAYGARYDEDFSNVLERTGQK